MTEQQRMNHWLRWGSIFVRVLAGIAILAIGFGAIAALVATKDAPERHEATGAPLRVRVMVAQPTIIDEVWRGYATARAMRDVDLTAQIAARVVERPPDIEPGARVAAGQLIIRLDDTEVREREAAARMGVASWNAQLDSLSAESIRWNDQLELAEEDAILDQAELRRVREARALGVATDAELDRLEKLASAKRREIAAIRQQIDIIPSRRAQLEASRDAEEASLRIAQDHLARATIIAPFDGILQHVAVRPGEVVAIGAAIARIVSLERVEVPLRLPASAAASIRPGAAARLWVDSPPGEAWTGAVARISPEIDPASRTILVFVEVNQSPDIARLLQPGRFVTGEVTSPGTTPGFIVPRHAVDGTRLMVIQTDAEGIALARAVEVVVGRTIEAAFPDLDPDEREWAVIEQGLAPGMMVILSNLDEIREGSLVVADLPGGAARPPTPGGASP